MIALAEAGLSTRILAAEMDVSKTAPLSWLRSRYPFPPELALAIERLTGDPELAREIIELIPSAQRRPLTANCADRPAHRSSSCPGLGAAGDATGRCGR